MDLHFSPLLSFCPWRRSSWHLGRARGWRLERWGHRVHAALSTKLVCLRDIPPITGSLSQSLFTLIISIPIFPWGRDGVCISILQLGNWFRLYVFMVSWPWNWESLGFQEIPKPYLHPRPPSWIQIPMSNFLLESSTRMALSHLNMLKNGLIILYSNLVPSASQSHWRVLLYPQLP